MALVDTLIDIGVRIPPLHPFINRMVVNISARRAAARPHPFSLWTPDPQTACADPAYVTWAGLADRNYTGRHLPPREPGAVLPPAPEIVEALFLRRLDSKGREITLKSSHTSVLFCFFAQWFTDSFLRTHPGDDRLNTSNHDIDLCEIYGLTEATAWALRERQGGRLKVERRNGADYPPLLYADGDVRPEFAEIGLTAGAAGLLASLPDQKDDEKTRKRDVVEAVFRAMAYPSQLRERVRDFLGTCKIAEEELQRRFAHLYATGVDRGSNTILYAAFNTLFIREHNRVAGEVAKANPDWKNDDHKVFHRTRNIMTVMLLKLTLEEYIRHLEGNRLPIRLDRTFAERQGWYRTNRIALEFVLLYRWHPMIPESLEIEGQQITARDYRWNNAKLEEFGIERLFAAASVQPAGSMRLRNTPHFMRHAEIRGLELSRKHKLQPFNAYRKAFGRTPYRTHEELTGDTATASALRGFYPNVDDVEFFVGLIAEQHANSSSFGRTMFDMVAADAFTHIFTSPLLAKGVHDLALGPEGMRLVEETSSLQDIVARNKATNTPVLAKFRLPGA